MSFRNKPIRCDIFCTVIDNFGDAAVSARLARQLVVEYGWQVRLWLDDLAPLAALWPGVSATASQQRFHGIEIHDWQPDKPSPCADAEVVVSAFGCRLPDDYLHAMTNHPPYWLNLEYLSAETWVEGCHGLPSPHPQLGLTQYFFFPGFSLKTGGLLREQNLLVDRDAFLHDAQQQSVFWHKLDLAPPPDTLRISLFGYRHAPLADLLSNLANCGQPVWCVLPAGQLEQAGQDWLNANPDSAVRLHSVPFLAQEDYDRLLWLCDINFVRGEDSLTRAIWAGKPFIWHIYPQEALAHHTKLMALLQRLNAHADPGIAHVVSQTWRAWNGMLSEPVDLHDWLEHAPGINNTFSAWSHELTRLPNLAQTLVNFCQIG